MSTVANTRKKLNMLKRAPCKEVILDALRVYFTMPIDTKEEVTVANIINNVASELERQYLQQIPKKQPKVKHRDLEDQISEMKRLREYLNNG